MTAVADGTAPVRPGAPGVGGVRSGPGGWRTARTVLRLHRTALVVWTAVVVGLSGWLVWLTEVTAKDERAVLDACAGQDWCDVTMVGLPGYSEPVGWITLATAYSFLAVAAFAGGALIGREVENGTAHLAWTQGITPARWLAAKLAVPALVLTLGSTALVLVFRWAWAANQDLLSDWTSFDVFLARGPAALAYALCALAVGALTALLLRRTLPALGVSVAAMWLLSLVLSQYRTSFWPAVTRTSATAEPDVPADAWQLGSGVLIHGRPAPNVDHWQCDGTITEAQRCLDDLGVTGYYATYHPASHYWPLHLVETAILLTVAATATATAFWTLHRRTA